MKSANSPRMSRNAFAFKVDYAREIAADEREIATLTSPLLVTLCPILDAVVARVAVDNPAWGNASQWDVYSLIVDPMITQEERARLMAVTGLTDADVEAWTVRHDDSRGPGAPRQVDVAGWSWERQRAVVRRGEEIEARLGRDAVSLYSEAKRLQVLKNAKASLARHRRNQKKFPGK